MATVQNLIDAVRPIINDEDATDANRRYPDAQMLVGFNDGMKLIRQLRPDLWYGTLGTAYADLAVGATFPLSPEYELAIKRYLVHHAELKDDEYTLKGRAAAFLQSFTSMVIGAS